MTSPLTNFFFANWQRKWISLFLALALWLSVNHSLTTRKTFTDVAVRVAKIPSGKTVEGILSSGLLAKKINITVVGRHSFLEKLTSSDFEISIDASQFASEEWEAALTKKHLVLRSSSQGFAKEIHAIVSHDPFTISLAKKVQDQIPLVITAPTGDAPLGYQFLQISPAHLNLTVSGPEKMIKELKKEGITLTFNLNNISPTDFQALVCQNSSSEEILFPIPHKWKIISLPGVSDLPLTIDDPRATSLQIVFVRSELLALPHALPISLFFPPSNQKNFTATQIHLVTNDLVTDDGSMHRIQKKLFVKNVSPFFLQTIAPNLQIIVTASPSDHNRPLQWSLQVINPKELENRYVDTLLANPLDEERLTLAPHAREKIHRSAFHHYLNNLQLYTEDGSQWLPHILLQESSIQIVEPVSKLPFGPKIALASPDSILHVDKTLNNLHESHPI